MMIKFIVFVNQNKDQNVSLSIVDFILKVSECRLLGVIMDDKLTWKYIAHVKSVNNISVLNKEKYVLDHKAMRILYCSLILPYFSYCVKAWGNTYISNIKPLFLL